MSKEALKAFGRLLMTRVRDEAIRDGEMLIDNEWSDPEVIKLAKSLSTLSPEQRACLRKLIIFCVDDTLHHMMWTLEQEEWIDVSVRSESGTVPSLREVSDGLAGELVRWIEQLSKYPGWADEERDPS